MTIKLSTNPATPTPSESTALTRAVRDLCHQLTTVAAAIHHDLGITGSLRAVLETLAVEGEQTVPQIARRKGVTRQYIRAVVNELGARDLVALHDNPAHRRSPLVALSLAGTTMFATIHERESVILRAVAPRLEGHDLAAAAATLRAFDEALAAR